MEPRVVRKTFKYKIMPSPSQERAMEITLNLCRELYNAGLEERKSAWDKCGVSVKLAAQSAQLPDIKEVRLEYRNVNAQVLQNVLRRLDRSFQNFFRRVKAGEKPGYPRFQGTRRYNSFTYPQVGCNGVHVGDGFLQLSKIGRVKLFWHRPMQGEPKTITISREVDGWYACISCTSVPTQPLSLTGNETGIDVGLKVFLVTADGDIVANPRHYRKSEQAIKKAQRRVSRRKKGSNRRAKAVKLLARKHLRVKRQRLDFHHRTALSLLRRYDAIYLEDLQVRNMTRNHKLAKSISDAGWAQFRAILEYKAECAGKRVFAIPPHYTSQKCSGCDVIVLKSLSVRTHACPGCGLVMDRDENAAINILRLGQSLQALTQATRSHVA